MLPPSDKRSTQKIYLAFAIVAHLLLLASLSAASFISKRPGPSFVSLLLHGLLVAQACLLALWLALSRRNILYRFGGFVIGMSGLLLLSLTANPTILSLGQLGLAVELFVVPAIVLPL
jgi:hypothetical protein